MSGKNIKRGAFIVFEGCDKNGKTTQSLKLVEKLNALKIPAKYMQFPDRSTTTGKLIDSYLKNNVELSDQAIHLLFTANRWEMEPQMKQLIKNGTTLIVDRYAFSGIAYSASKPGLTIEWCRLPETGLPKPDLVFLLRLGSVFGAGRDDFGTERYEKENFQKAVYENYMKMVDETWMLINADKSIEELHEELFQHAQKAINSAENDELKLLW